MTNGNGGGRAAEILRGLFDVGRVRAVVTGAASGLGSHASSFITGRAYVIDGGALAG